jgi:hypothetical protein
VFVRCSSALLGSIRPMSPPSSCRPPSTEEALVFAVCFHSPPLPTWHPCCCVCLCWHRVFPELQAYIDATHLLGLSSADRLSVADVGGLADLAAVKGVHVAQWLLQAWGKLRHCGLKRSLPRHPQLLLLGYYDRLQEDAPPRRGFKIQRFISQEFASHVGDALQSSLSQPSLASRNLSNQHSGASAWLRDDPTGPISSSGSLGFQAGCSHLLWPPPGGASGGHQVHVWSTPFSLP